jgi:hypothetical protein
MIIHRVVQYLLRYEDTVDKFSDLQQTQDMLCFLWFVLGNLW